MAVAEYLDLEVSLRGVADPPRRRFLLRRDVTFAQLHAAIQAACGWEDRHLYAFFDGRQVVAALNFDEPLGPDADAVPVSDHLEPTSSLAYEYDFGDSWHHDVVLHGLVDHEASFGRRLADGARAFPPEDCGGLPGYEELVEIRAGRIPEWLADQPQELEWRREWMGDWEPEAFDLDTARAVFDR